MRSGWFWGTEMWEQYQQAYWRDRKRPEEYKSSPLADDEDLKEAVYGREWEVTEHETQVLDLTQMEWISESALKLKWGDVRDSYRSLINGAMLRFGFNDWAVSRLIAHRYRDLHRAAFGNVRNDETFRIQEKWIEQGYGLFVLAWRGYEEIDLVAAGAYWIVYHGKAYYASGPSVEHNVQHAVIWHSLALLKHHGIQLVELGPIDGATDKEKNIGHFKTGFGGKARPYIVARRKTASGSPLHPGDGGHGTAIFLGGV